jgi:hypothetical protein
MRFGSYEESEQQDQSVDTDDEKTVNAHEDHEDGDVSFESEKSTDELVDQLQHMKDDE